MHKLHTLRAKVSFACTISSRWPIILTQISYRSISQTWAGQAGETGQAPICQAQEGNRHEGVKSGSEGKET